MNRPEKRHTIDVQMKDRLFEVFDDVRDNPEVWVAVLIGGGRDMNMEGGVRFAETLSARIRHSADAKDGLVACREKRQPLWQGR